MAIINEFERQRLASSVVGTPGVDRSAGAGFGAISEVAGAAANELFRIKKARQEAEDQIFANKIANEFEFNQKAKLQEHQKAQSEFRGDPEDRAKLFETTSRDDFNAVLGTIDSPRVKDLFSLAGDRVISRLMSQELQAAESNRIILADSDAKDTLNLHAQDASALFSDDSLPFDQKVTGLEEIMAKGEETFTKYAPALDTANREKLKKLTPEMISKGALSSGVIRSPGETLQLLETGFFNDVLSPQDVEVYKQRARAGVENLPAILERENFLKEIENNRVLYDAYRENNPALPQMLEEAEDTPFVKEMKELVYESGPSEEVKSRELLRLTAKYQNMLEQKKKSKKGQVKGKVSLEEILGLMTEITKARNQKSIDDGVLDTMMKKMALPLFERVKKETGRSGFLGIFDAPDNLDLGFRMITDWLDGQNREDETDVKADMFLDFFAMMDDQNITTKDGTRAIANTVIQRQTIKDDPSIARLEGSPEQVLDANRNLHRNLPRDKNLKVGSKIDRRSEIRPRLTDGKRFEFIYENDKLIEVKELK